MANKRKVTGFQLRVNKHIIDRYTSKQRQHVYSVAARLRLALEDFDLPHTVEVVIVVENV